MHHREHSIRKDRLLYYLNHEKQYRCLTPDDIVRYCIQFSLLLSRGEDDDSFWLFSPGLGELTQEILAARKEIYSIIRKKQYKEMFLSDLEKIIRVKSSERGMKFHLAEMIGAGKLNCVNTNVGTLVTIPKEFKH